MANGSRGDFRGDSGRDPFEILAGTLDDMVTRRRTGRGAAPGRRVPGVVGSARPGHAGARRTAACAARAHIEAMAQRAVAMVEQGLAG